MITAFAWFFTVFFTRECLARLLCVRHPMRYVTSFFGTVMYVVEGPGNGFTSIPTSVYWAITTLTTVGFGDITPRTDLGRLISSFMMLLGWGTLAVPTGIVTAEMAAQRLGRSVSPAGGRSNGAG